MPGRSGARLIAVTRVFLGLLVAFALGVAPAASASAVVHADRDRDKVSDDLEPALTGSQRLPILVSLDARASAERVDAIERDVGDLGPVTRLRLVDAFAARADAGRRFARWPRAGRRARRGGCAGRARSASRRRPAFGVARAREDIPDLDGHGLVAAVIDTGIDTRMPDLADARWSASRTS